MSDKNDSRKLLGLQDANITDVKETEKEIEVFVTLEIYEHYCPRCGEITTKIHDYRTQRITDLPFRGKKLFIILRKRRYVCSHCGKRFYENNSFLPRYRRMTNRMSAYILDQLRNTDSFTSIAKKLGISTPTVIRIFDSVSYGKPKLPNTLSIDEFKGNTGKEKYQVIITDPVNHKVLDILSSRKKYDLTKYFKNYPKEERRKIQYYISDMYKPYKDLCETWFKNSTIIVDKYHWIRQAIWAVENIRKQVQKQFIKSYRIYFKHSRKLLLMHAEDLKDEQKIQVSVMLSVSAELSIAYYLKESLYKILTLETREEAKKALSDWIATAENSGIQELKPAVRAYRNWFTEIVNSCCQPLTNGFTEGCNNKIKVLKRNAYGYRDFERFRKRILFMFDNAT